LSEREQNPGSRSDAAESRAGDGATRSGGDDDSVFDTDPKTSEFDERRWNRGRAAVDREREARRREANAAARDQVQAAADEGTQIRRGAADDRAHAAADRDIHASERDRSQAEADTGTRVRRGAADDREHAAADRDEHASERDVKQAAAEQDGLDRSPTPDEMTRSALRHERSDAETGERASNRDQAADDRVHAASDRHDDALDRDQAEAQAARRTSDRDQAAEDRHQAAFDRDQTAADRDVYQAAADQRTANRNESARDREHAAADREQAIADREGADRDYRLRRQDLQRAQLDQLTGAFGREVGLLLLEREIDRARHGNGELVLAYIDVDGLKQVNDEQGHAAGDALLADIAGAIHKHLRSYDMLVRVGGDEFVCALGDCTHAIALTRFDAIRSTMRPTQPAASISVGFTTLRPDDTLEQLTARGDLAMYEAKRSG
jgi:diguanylate cyclase (GGDEF)-like protein